MNCSITQNSESPFDFFWWRIEFSFFKDLEESLLWKLETLAIKTFSIEHFPTQGVDPKLTVWLPSYEWEKQDRRNLELSFIDLTKVFESKTLDFKWEKIPQEDWSSTWKKFWQPDPIGKNLLVLPTWLELPLNHQNRLVIKLDPGSAFGTGSHPTTRLCLEALERNPPKNLRVADIGCGSGILGIASLLLGAKQVLAVDLDSLAVRATQENRLLNNIDLKKLIVSNGSIDALQEQLQGKNVDLLLCNILAPVIKKLAVDFSEVVSESGHLLLSGLLVNQIEEIINILSIWDWKLISSYTQEQWALIYLCRNPH